MVIIWLTLSLLLNAADPAITIPGELSANGIQVARLQQPSNLLEPRTQQALKSVAPYLLILTNNSSEPVAEVNVQYFRDTTDGRTVVGTTRLQTHGRFVPGSSIVQSPSGMLTQLIAEGRLGNTVAMDQAIASVNQIFAPSRFSSATILLDSIVFGSGRVIGPDKFGVIAERQADSDAASMAAAKLFDASTTDSQLTHWLTTMKSQGEEIDANGSVDHRLKANDKLARMLIQLLQNGATREALSSLCLHQQKMPLLFR